MKENKSKKRYLVSRFVEWYACIDANSAKEAVFKADNKKTTWRRTMNLMPKDGEIQEIEIREDNEVIPIGNRIEIE